MNTKFWSENLIADHQGK